jgi:hypothetical protein
MVTTPTSPGFSQPEQPNDSDSISATLTLDQFKLKKVQLQDFPNTLPLGFFVGDRRIINFSLNPFDPEQDLLLAKLYSNQKADLKQILGQFLPQAIDKIGDYTVQELARELSCTPQKLIERMPLADALTVVLNQRQSNVGEEIAINEQCPNCNTRNNDDPEEGRPYHDLGEVEIGLLPQLNDKLVLEVNLTKGFKIGPDLCKKVLMQPMKLYDLPKLAKVPRGKLDLAMMYLQVCAIPESSMLSNVAGQLFDDDTYSGIKNLKDRELLLSASRKLQQLGPDMNLMLSCFNCGHEWRTSLPWPDLRNFLFAFASPAE